MSLVVPLYSTHWLFIGRRIETDEFCLQQRLTSEVFIGRPALFDKFNIFVGPNDDTEKQIIHQVPQLWLTNASTSAAYFILLRRLVEPTLNSYLSPGITPPPTPNINTLFLKSLIDCFSFIRSQQRSPTGTLYCNLVAAELDHPNMSVISGNQHAA